MNIGFIVYILSNIIMSWDNAVGTATGYGLDDQRVRVRVPVESRILYSQRCPDRLWGTARLLSNEDPDLFPRGQRGLVVKPTTHLQQCRGQENMDLYIHSPIHLDGAVLN
jgi:hypothetical protein